MALFTKTNSKQTASNQQHKNSVTIIATGNHIAGQFTIAGALHVDGQIEGEVCSEGRIEVGSQGDISGVIRAISMHVAGIVKANICCQQLTILQGGEVHGQLQCGELVVEPGGQFYGERKAQTADSNGQLQVEFIEQENTDIAADIKAD